MADGVRRGFLTMREGRDVGRRFVLRPGQRFTLGRSPAVTIPIEDVAVSRRHATVELSDDGSILVTDLHSRNGTLVGGIRLGPGEGARLREGQLLQLGDTVFAAALQEEADAELEGTREVFQPMIPAEFELLGEVGRGATGIVYAARQRLLGRRVAIKVPRVVSDQAELNRRFLREAQLQCQVDSPYVVSIFDVRQVGDWTYLMLELVNGFSVRDQLVGGPLPLHEALRIAELTARALDATHQARVIHRDVKPANILLTPEGGVKLSDFGIAKGVEDSADMEPLTGSNEGLGTLCYVAPEQATTARLADARADIYSLGATLFHMIAGRPPFAPRSQADLLRQVAQGVPRLDELCPECPREVAELIYHMLEPMPADRPESAAALATKLHQRWETCFATSRFRSLSKEDLRQTGEFVT